MHAGILEVNGRFTDNDFWKGNLVPEPDNRRVVPASIMGMSPNKVGTELFGGRKLGHEYPWMTKIKAIIIVIIVLSP
jgi:hypothetical protein